MASPLIMCHYGNSSYLPHVFECARHSNKELEIYLLGDESNRWLADKFGITHIPFKDYHKGSSIEKFDSVYRLIEGAKHSNDRGWGRDWVNFVFIRWFYIDKFIKERNISSFWHFDTDTMILDDLGRHEYKFDSYDATEQCNASCLNGFISNTKIVNGYISKINELFERRNFIENQKKEFQEENPEYAFTEMRAFSVFKEEEDIRTFHIAKPVNYEVFDDALCLTKDYKTEKLDNGREIKKIWLDKYGRFYGKKEDDNLYRFITLNLSWLSDPIYVKVLNHIKVYNIKSGNKPAKLINTLGEVSLPLAYRIYQSINILRSLKHRIIS